MSWRRALRGDPIPWLLESEDPPVRYRALVDILGRSERDPEVQRARAAIPGYGPVAELLDAQHREGYWLNRDYYLPKTSGTFWTLSVLADLGLSRAVDAIHRGCEFMFTFQRDNGAFCRRRRVAGRGLVWDTEPGPCTHARIVRFLIQSGYGDDARTGAAIDYLLSTRRPDGMWLCHPTGRHGCLRATHDALRSAVLEPALIRHPVVVRAAGALHDLLMEPRMHRYHVPDQWMVLEYPFFGYGAISTLDTLGRLGHGLDSPRMAAAMDWLLGRQLPGGGWPLDQIPRRPPIDVGQPKQPEAPAQANKWVTLEAVCAVKRLFEDS